MRRAFEIRTDAGLVNRSPWDGVVITRQQAHKAAIRALGIWSAAPIWNGRSLKLVEV